MKFKIALLLLLILLFCGIIICFLIFRKFYSRELSLRLSPLTENNLLLATSTRFWLVGDSRFYQWHIPDSIIPRSQYCNLGLNAQTTAQVYYRLRQHFDQGIPAYLFLQVGINDLKAIGVFPGRKEEIIGQCINNIESILKICIDKKISPVFCTIFPPGTVEIIRLPIWSKEINTAVVRVNDSVTDFCKNNNMAVFDAYAELSDGNGILKKNYQLDDLHLNEEGYKILNKELEKFLTREKLVIK